MTDQPYSIIGADRDSRWLLSCDHATNRVPAWVNGGDLGIGADDMARHIAYDVGAAGLTRHLADALGAPAILSDFSRLVIDPNRAAADPTVLMRLYDGTVIPANRHADAAEKQRRIARLHRPYHDAYARLAAARPDRIILAIHSFTRQLRGRPPRPWQIALLHAHQDQRLAPAVIRACRAEGWITGDNEPYGGHLEGDSIDTHALRHGRPNLLIELRNDLIATDADQRRWAARLAPLLTRVLAETGV